MRLFVAIPLPGYVKQQLARLRQPIDGIRWQDKEQLHLTLKFLGDTRKERFVKLKEALEDIEISSFTITIKGFGYFPEGEQPRVLWAGIDENDTLTVLYKTVESTCQNLNFEAESRPFRPHVTIARIKDTPKRDVVSFINQHKQFRISDVEIDEFVLYESKLQQDGAKHSRRKTFKLS